ncbi:MAG TPA: glycosyltransferase family 2 protein, partial [Candidatus Acidoferrales bacterium]|nr:glycosyltransferase family 2 protein [Candidatus Acidoferrales bacterium]
MTQVSIIVPNYNHARYLPKRIESILRQTYQDFELILLDDRSTDDSRSVLSRYANDPRVRVEFNDVNSGSPFRQWNKGVQLARGPYVWIAESDDYAHERLLERLVPLLEDDEAATFAYCRSWCVSDSGDQRFADAYLNSISGGRWGSDFRADGLEECRRYLVFTNSIPNASAVLFRKAAYERAGGADGSYRVCGDWKLWATMASAGRIAYVAEPLNYFRFHEESVCR